MPFNVAIVGYGKLGRYLVDRIIDEGAARDIAISFVWSRSADWLEEQLKKDPKRCHLLVLKKLENIKYLLEEQKPDLIVEVCHPDIIKEYGLLFLTYSNLMIGSPTVLADEAVERSLKSASKLRCKRIFVARGALWGAEDIQNMAQTNNLDQVHILMYFHPKSIRLTDKSTLKPLNDAVLEREGTSTEPVRLYAGPVRELCTLAPNNVNTMAAAALAGLGFDRTMGTLYASPGHQDYHQVDISVVGKKDESLGPPRFSVESSRKSRTASGQDVSSTLTSESFWCSVLKSIEMLELPPNKFEVEIC